MSCAVQGVAPPPREQKRRRIADDDDDLRTQELISHGVLSLTPKSRKRLRPLSLVGAERVPTMNLPSMHTSSPVAKRAKLRSDALSDRASMRYTPTDDSFCTPAQLAQNTDDDGTVLRHGHGQHSSGSNDCAQYIVSVHLSSSGSIGLPNTVSVHETLQAAEDHALSYLSASDTIEPLQLDHGQSCVISAWQSRDTTAIVARTGSH